MSMKVYPAYKVVKSKGIWELLWGIQDKAETNVVSLLRDHYIDLVVRMDPDSEEYKVDRAKAGDRPEYSFRLCRARDFVHDHYKQQLGSSRRNPYALDVTIAVYPHGSSYYLRPFCDSFSVVGSALDFMEAIPELTDYHYQNSTDKPDEISSREWSARKRVWNTISGRYRDIGRHVSLDVLSWSGFWQLDPWLDLLREWHKNPPVLPIREQVWANDIIKLKSLFGSEVECHTGFLRIGSVTVVRQDSGVWVSTINGVSKEFDSLNRAADHVYFEHLPESTRDMISHYVNR